MANEIAKREFPEGSQALALVDAGFVDDTTQPTEYLQHQTANRALQRIHVNAHDITDLIIPGHDHDVFTRYSPVAQGVLRIR